MLFSATLAGGVDAVVTRYMHNPVSHAAGVEAPVLLEHRVLVVESDDRVSEIAKMARAGRVVVFTRTKHRARQLARKLEASGVGAVDLHGNLSQNARERNLAAFADGTATALVATDIAARGIHVDDVPLVVHADPPVEHKAYVHRSGRTARAGARGAGRDHRHPRPGGRGALAAQQGRRRCDVGGDPCGCPDRADRDAQAAGCTQGGKGRRHLSELDDPADQQVGT